MSKKQIKSPEWHRVWRRIAKGFFPKLPRKRRLR